MLRTSVKDRFSAEGDFVFTCLAYDAESSSSSQGAIKDSLFAGTLSGHIASFPIAQRSYGDKAAEREISPVYFPAEEKHYSQVTCLLISYDLVLSSDGTADTRVECLLSGSMDRTVKIWTKNSRDGLNYSSIQTLSGHSGKITAIVATTQNGIITSSFDGNIRLYTRSKKPQSRPMDELISNIRYYLFECTGIYGDTTSWLTSVVLLKAISPYGNWTVYVSTSEGHIHLYRSSNTSSMIAENKHPSLLKYTTWHNVHALEISSMTLIQSQQIIVTISNDNTSKIIDTSKGVTFFVLHNPNCRYTCLTWLPLNNYLLYGDEHGRLELVALSKERSLARISISSLQNHLAKKVKSLVKMPILGHLATHLKLKNAIITLYPNSSEIYLLELDINEQRIEILGHSSRIVSIATLNATYKHPELRTAIRQRITFDEMPVFSVEASGVIRCWDDYDNKFRFEVNERFGSEVTSMLAIWSLNSVVTGHENGSVLIWNLSTGVKKHSDSMKGAVITALISVYLKPTDFLLIAGDSKGRVSITNLVSNENQRVGGKLSVDRMFQGHHEDAENIDPCILSLGYFDDCSVLLSGGEDCTLRAWEINTNNQVQCLKAPTNQPISTITVLRYLMVTGDEGGSTCFWRISQPDCSDAVVTLEILRVLSPLISTLYARVTLPSDRAIISCCSTKEYFYVSRSAECSCFTEIWRISVANDSALRDAVKVMNIRHDSYSVSCSAMCLDLELNPLGRNQIILGTSEGLILKYQFSGGDLKIDETISS